MEPKKYQYVRKCFTFKGLEYQATGKTEEDAIEKKIKMLKALKKGEPIRQHRKERGESALSSEMTVSDYSAVWLETFVHSRIRAPGTPKKKKTITQKTYDNYVSKVEHYILPSIGKMKICNVLDIHIQQILNASKEAGMSKSHCEKLYVLLKDMFDHAVSSKVIDSSPITEEVAVTACDGKKRRSLTKYELKILKEVAKTHRCGMWIKFLLATGIRPAESAPLCIKDLDLDADIVHIYQAIESGTEKVVGPPKSKAGIRDVPISYIHDELVKYIEGRDPDEFLFPQTDGKTMMTTTAIANNWRSFRRQMDLAMGAETTNHGHIYDPKDIDKDGIPLYPDENGNPRNGHKIADDLVLYCLRHTFCTNLQKSGVPLGIAKTLMGHEDIKITLEIYTHSDTDDVIQAGNLLSRYLQSQEDD